ncbi:hypothetical protein [Kitasatospora sp. A2-31]|uniref:hypothetical protein n=1 Tax=Kitasatospora sp. A2-31 TaxID=2916414 RepID=UPI001EE86C78|nr:hypothetical protein [Kitasatospora sp. A2-31]MCG6493417.1 hypothetical protein [Kitasatospora sp. A2-31]
MTTTSPPGRFDWPFAVRPARIAWHAAMAIVRPAAAAMAGWSLYVVARHYGMPHWLAFFCVAVFDGIGMGCLYQATEAVRAGRSAFTAIIATLGMASISVYLNIQHARIIGRGLPAEVMFATPAVGLLVLSALSWAATRANARAERGESPMRLPTYGLWGWVLAPQQAAEALQQRARAHVTSGASPAHQPASLPPARTAEDVIAAEFANIGPAAAVQRVAAANPGADDAEIAEILATYRVTLSAAQVGLLLERAAVPTVRLDRVPKPPNVDEHPALDPAHVMRGDAPQVNGMSLAGAITTMARHLGGLDADAKTVAQHLALQGMATDTTYIRTALSRARKTEEKLAAEAAAQAEHERAEYERRNGNGGYA